MSKDKKDALVTIPDEKRLQTKVKRALSRIILKNPFFSMIMLNQNIIYSTEIPTMGVNGRDIFINLEFVRNLTPDEVIGVMIHECTHLCWNHVTRCGNRNPKLWNYAGDYAINPSIKKDGFILPQPHLDEERFHEMSADEIYQILYQEQPDIDPQFLDIQGQNLSEADKKKIEHEAKITIAKALQVAGDHAPDALRKALGEIMEPSAPWEQVLREFMQTTLGDLDSTWRRPSRNYIHQNLYLPSSEGVALPNIVVAFDTSGSIYYQKELLERFTNEVNAIIEDLIPEQVDVYCVDTAIRSHNTYDEGTMPEYDITGGGGTDFTSFFQHILTVAEPACIIFFSDMYASGLPTLKDGFPIPILWCVYDNKEPPEDVAGKYVIVS